MNYADTRLHSETRRRIWRAAAAGNITPARG